MSYIPEALLKKDLSIDVLDGILDARPFWSYYPAQRRGRKIRKPTPKKKKKPRKIPRFCRENVPEWNFALSDRDWSAWKLAMDSESQRARSTAWMGRRHGPGFKIRNLFSESRVQTLYEVAVQCKKYQKKLVVYHRFGKFSCKPLVWESQLFRHGDVVREVDLVIRNGCKLYVRRLPLRKKNATVKLVMKALKRYDYAWNKIKGQRSAHRLLQKNGVKISDPN